MEQFITSLADKNWLDIGVLIVIGVFFLIGLSSGLIFSAFRLLSMVIALFMSLSFYDRLAGFIYGTYAETVIDAFIYDGFLSNPEVSAAQYEINVDNALDGIIKMLRLPNGAANAIFTKPASLGEISRTNIFNDIDIIGHFSSQCTKAVIALFSVIAVYVIIRVIIAIVKIFLDEVAALKIFRIFNYIGGPVFGLIEGIAVVYIALSFIMLINIVVQLDAIYEIVDKSRFSRGLYENNLFLNYVLNNIKL
jgi:uncharacterized membrane protein required for colicin V production